MSDRLEVEANGEWVAGCDWAAGCGICAGSMCQCCAAARRFLLCIGA